MPRDPRRPNHPADRPSLSPAAGSSPDLRGSQHATADYIWELSQQLAAMATTVHLDLLAYLLDMVRIEADQIRARVTPADENR